VRLFCLSIDFLVVQSDCCHFRQHEHSPTTWDIRSINGFFLLCLMLSTFNPRLSQISLNMPTNKVDNLFAFTKLQILRERVKNLYSRFTVSRKQIKQKKVVMEKDTYENVQINIADITK